MSSHSLAGLQRLGGDGRRGASATRLQSAHRGALSPDRQRVAPDLLPALSTSVGAADHRYWPTRRGDSLVARAVGIESTFSPAGLRVTLAARSLHMALARVSRGAADTGVADAAPSAKGAQVSYRRGAIEEYYRTGPFGVEQAFTLASRPLRGAGPLLLELAVRGSLRPHGGGSQITFATPAGAAALSYGQLSAVDASGRSLPASMRVQAGAVALAIDDRGARYPLRVDPFIQQGSKLTGGAEEVGKGEFGKSVTLSADGKTALVGVPQDNGERGAAWVFVRPGATWEQQGPKLTGSAEVGRSRFGFAVALSGDGNTALIGGIADNLLAGAAWVFTRSLSTWTQQGEKLTGGGESGEGRFGFRVALSGGAGNTALIGGPADKLKLEGEVEEGSASDAEVKEGSKIVKGLPSTIGLVVGRQVRGAKITPGTVLSKVINGSEIELSIAVEGTSGNSVKETLTFGGSKIVKGLPSTIGLSVGTVVSGAKITPGTLLSKVINATEIELSTEVEGTGTASVKEALTFVGTPTGAAWVFTRSSGIWTQQGEKLAGTGESGAGEFGTGVALSGDGNAALIGGSGDNSKAGAAWVFTRSEEKWTQQGEKLTGGGEEVGAAHFGFNVALDEKADTALIGGGQDNGEVGAAWVFVHPASTWEHQGPKLTGGGESGKGHFGASVALSAEGNAALIGAPADANEAGAAWAFKRSGTTWEQLGTKTRPTDESGKGHFGDSLALSGEGNAALVGGDHDASEVGAAWWLENVAPPPPTVVTGTASYVTQETAVLNASVNPNGGKVSDCHFEWGTTIPYTFSALCSSLPGAGVSPVAVSAALEHLSPHTTYHFQIVATNEAGTSSGADQTFTTGEPPEFGRCAKVPGEKVGTTTVYHGGFTTSTCTERNATRSGPFEWTRGAVKAGFTSTLKEGLVTLETVKKVKLTCNSETTHGKWAGTQQVENVVVKLSGCESAGKKCTTPTLTEGEMETKTLEGTLGWEAKATKKVALDVFPVGKTGAYMEYRCGPETEPMVTVEGSLLVPVTVDKMLLKYAVKYAQLGGKQKPEHFEGLPSDVLTAVHELTSEQIGQAASTTLTSEETLEINAVV